MSICPATHHVLELPLLAPLLPPLGGLRPAHPRQPEVLHHGLGRGEARLTTRSEENICSCSKNIYCPILPVLILDRRRCEGLGALVKVESSVECSL